MDHTVRSTVCSVGKCTTSFITHTWCLERRFPFLHLRTDVTHSVTTISVIHLKFEREKFRNSETKMWLNCVTEMRTKWQKGMA